MLREARRWVRVPAVCCAALALGAGAAVAVASPASADEVRSAQMWVLNAINAPTAWRATEGRGVVVAVIDSGVDPAVSDLTGSVIAGPDLAGVATSPSNAGWGVHGTWMASLISGHGHAAGGGSGVMGVAPMSKVLSIRVVTDKTDPGYNQYQQESDSRVQRSLASAISYATAHGASVISMSLGYGSPSAVVRSALQKALGHGVVVVASSGNSGDSVGARTSGQAPYSFPADYPGVLGVAAVSQSGAAADFSSDNLSVQVGAPGVDVPAQGRDGQYWLVSGTSPACALTAGVAALIKARYPHLAPALVVRAITSSTQNRPVRGYDDKVGFGTVDAAAAMTAAATLAAEPGGQPAAAATRYFGGGSAAVSPVPVRPRSVAGLAVSSLLALISLTIAVMAWTRLIVQRRARRRAVRGALAQTHAAAWPGRSQQDRGPGVPLQDLPLANTAGWPADSADHGLDQPWMDAGQ